MTLTQWIESLPEYARDTRLNLDTLLKSPETPGLTPSQRAGIALACTYACENHSLLKALEEEYATELTPEIRFAAQGAATLMAMNNVYYRFLHLAEDPEIKKLPAKLRMNLIGKPGIPKVDFELMCLAVSALSGCGACIKSHIEEVKKAGLSLEGIQSSARLAAGIQAGSRAFRLAQTE